MTSLVGRTLARVRTLLVVLAALLVSFQVTIVAVATSLDQAHSLERIAALVPSYLQGMFGAAMSSFAGLCSIGFFEPLIVMLIVQFAIYVGTEPAGDVELGLVDLLLARSIPRHVLVTRSLLVMTASALFLPLVMVAALWSSLPLLAPAGVAWPQWRTIYLLAAHLAAIAWCFGAAGLAAAAFARRRGSAQAVVGVGAVGLYLADFVGDAWSRGSWLASVSPFHRFHGGRILVGETNPARDLAVLGALGVVAAAVAYWQFQRRDV